MKNNIIQQSVAIIAYYVGSVSGSTDQYKNWMKARNIIIATVNDPSIMGDIDLFKNGVKDLDMPYTQAVELYYNKEVRSILVFFFVGTYEGLQIRHGFMN